MRTDPGPRSDWQSSNAMDGSARFEASVVWAEHQRQITSSQLSMVEAGSIRLTSVQLVSHAMPVGLATNTAGDGKPPARTSRL